MSLAPFIDHTILKPTTTLAEIEKVCAEAIEYNFAAVCVPPYYVADAVQRLQGHAPRVATVVGFPFGYSHYNAKIAETEKAVEDGAHEIDLVMHLAALKSNDIAYLETEISAILVARKNAKLKVIVESGILSEEELLRVIDLYRHYPIDYMKTSTGYAEKGATIEAVRTMRAHLPERTRIKASGGIRDHVFAQQLVDAGATRLGCSASVAIVKGEKGGQASGY
ncbi:deoxyribose-phosphate aldolase [Flaviaesturariibacter flavus]|uniref:Deoxyribose-phosphate aldolase n=1 Tax=Flaviaesturariibacter flavus TaxID=2502780 RepID=A0A4R1BMG3_9BACT|nr:deoxyribose-phosphate aldolase [Flaviaesturariibacter flavus]TCJ18624.1 deoxyribose-phosphate aldolase [Flaviaesturariibacter flavus]